jgi:hypothetical protein
MPRKSTCHLIISLFTLVFLLSAEFAAAQTQEGPCALDRRRLCSNVQPGAGRITACMKAHEKQLSAACRVRRQTVKQTRTKRKSVLASCSSDSAKLCSGKKAPLRCLNNHQAKVSAACRAALRTLKK